MPWNQVMKKFGAGTLRSGSPSGPKVGNPKQALAIMLSEKAAAAGGTSEYAAAPAPARPRLAVRLGAKMGHPRRTEMVHPEMRMHAMPAEDSLHPKMRYK